MDQVAAAVHRWRRRIGPSTVFDGDDARQEAALRVWLSGGRPEAAYWGIVSALRVLMPGWRDRRALSMLPLADDYEGEHLDTPEEILIAKQTAVQLVAGPKPKPKPKPKTPVPRVEPAVAPADPFVQRLREEALAASIMYGEAMSRPA